MKGKIEALTLRDFANIFRKLDISDIRVEVRDEGWYVAAVDPANVMIAEVLLSKNGWESYDFKPKVFALDIEKLYHYAQDFRKGEVVEIALEDTAELMASFFLNGTLVRTFKLLEEEAVRAKPKIPELEYKIELTLLAPQIKIIKDVLSTKLEADWGNEIGIGVVERTPGEYELCAYASDDEGVKGKACVPLERATHYLVIEPCASVYNVDYFKSIFGLLTKEVVATGTVTMQFAFEYPLKISYERKGLEVKQILLAPRVDEAKKLTERDVFEELERPFKPIEEEEVEVEIESTATTLYFLPTTKGRLLKPFKRTEYSDDNFIDVLLGQPLPELEGILGSLKLEAIWKETSYGRYSAILKEEPVSREPADIDAIIKIVENYKLMKYPYLEIREYYKHPEQLEKEKIELKDKVGTLTRYFFGGFGNYLTILSLNLSILKEPAFPEEKKEEAKNNIRRSFAWIKKRYEEIPFSELKNDDFKPLFEIKELLLTVEKELANTTLDFDKLIGLLAKIGELGKEYAKTVDKHYKELTGKSFAGLDIEARALAEYQSKEQIEEHARWLQEQDIKPNSFEKAAMEYYGVEITEEEPPWRRLLDVIKELEKEHGLEVPEDIAIAAAAMEVGIEKPEDLISELKRDGILYSPAKGLIARVEIEKEPDLGDEGQLIAYQPRKVKIEEEKEKPKEEPEILSLSALKEKYLAIPWDEFVDDVFKGRRKIEPCVEYVDLPHLLVHKITVGPAEEVKYGAVWDVKSYDKEGNVLVSKGFKTEREAFLDFHSYIRDLIKQEQEREEETKETEPTLKEEAKAEIEKRIELAEEIDKEVKEIAFLPPPTHLLDNPKKVAEWVSVQAQRFKDLASPKDLRMRAWSEHVKATGLKPAMDAKDFYRIFDEQWEFGFKKSWEESQKEWEEALKKPKKEEKRRESDIKERMEFGDLPEESETEGVGKNKGILYRRDNVVAVDDEGLEYTYSVQIDSIGNKKVKKLGMTDRQREELQQQRLEEIPSDVREIVDYYWPDTNLTQKQILGAAISNMEFDERSLSVVLGGNIVKRKFLELFPNVDSFDAAVSALRELRSIGIKEVAPEPEIKVEAPKEPETPQETIARVMKFKSYTGSRPDWQFLLNKAVNDVDMLKADRYDLMRATGKLLGYNLTPEPSNVGLDRWLAQQLANETGQPVLMIGGSVTVEPEKLKKEETYEEVLEIVAKDLKGKMLSDREIVDYANQKGLPLGWVQTGYVKANPPTAEQLKREIEELKKRQDKLPKTVTSRAQATTREANLGKLQEVIDGKMRQLREMEKQKEPWMMTYREFIDIAGSEYGAGERFGVPTKNRVPINPETGYLIKGATPEERIHRAVLMKALAEDKPVPEEVLVDYQGLALKYGIELPSKLQRFPPSQRPTPKEKIAEIARLYKEGKSIPEIRKYLNVSQRTVYRTLNEYNIPVRERGYFKGNISSNIREEIVRLYVDEKLSTYDIGEMLGVSPVSAFNILKEKGISLRNKSEAGAIAVQSKGTGSTKRGLSAPWYSVKNKAWAKADSRYELVRMHQLDNDPNVIMWTKQTERIPYGKNRFYVPDFYIEYKDGRKVVEEIKAFYKIKDANVLEKEKAAKEHLKDKNIDYKLVTENEIGIEYLRNFDYDQIPLLTKEEKQKFKRASSKGDCPTKAPEIRIEVITNIFDNAEVQSFMSKDIATFKIDDRYMYRGASKEEFESLLNGGTSGGFWSNIPDFSYGGGVFLIAENKYPEYHHPGEIPSSYHLPLADIKAIYANTKYALFRVYPILSLDEFSRLFNFRSETEAEEHYKKWYLQGEFGEEINKIAEIEIPEKWENVTKEKLEEIRRTSKFSEKYAISQAKAAKKVSGTEETVFEKLPDELDLGTWSDVLLYSPVEEIRYLSKAEHTAFIKLVDRGWFQVYRVAKPVSDQYPSGFTYVLKKTKEEEKPPEKEILYYKYVKKDLDEGAVIYTSYPTPVSEILIAQLPDGRWNVHPDPPLFPEKPFKTRTDALEYAETNMKTVIEEETGEKKPPEIPKIPEEGITEDWIKDVIAVDPKVSPVVVAGVYGKYGITFEKFIPELGEVVPLCAIGKETIPEVEELLDLHKYENMVWSDDDITWTDKAKRYREIWYKEYTKDELRDKKVDEIKEIAKIKNLSTIGKKEELIARITAKEVEIPVKTKKEEEIHEYGKWIRENAQTADYKEVRDKLREWIIEYYKLDKDTDYVFKRSEYDQIEIGINDLAGRFFDTAANGWDLLETFEEWEVQETREEFERRLHEKEKETKAEIEERIKPLKISEAEAAITECDNGFETCLEFCDNDLEECYNRCHEEYEDTKDIDKCRNECEKERDKCHDKCEAGATECYGDSARELIERDIEEENLTKAEEDLETFRDHISDELYEELDKRIKPVVEKFRELEVPEDLELIPEAKIKIEKGQMRL